MIGNKMLCLIAGVGAGVLRSVMGWLESGEPFNKRLMFMAIIRTALLGGMFGFGSDQHPIAVFFEVYFTDTIMHKSYKIEKNRQS